MLAFACSAAHADWLQLTSLTTGAMGTFAGSLGGVGVTGGIPSSGGDNLQLNGNATNSWEQSNIGDTSPQFSDSGVYAFATAQTDELGLTWSPTSNTAVLTINFAQQMTDVVLQIANLDESVWDLSNTAGLTGLSLLSGNGGSGGGLGISGDTVLDLNPATQVGQSQGATPLASGDRSAYGSVELLGTYSSLVVDIGLNPTLLLANADGDGFNFTLVSTPEPSSIALLVVIVAFFSIQIWVRRRRSV